MRRCVIVGAAPTRIIPSCSPSDFIIAADGGKAQLGNVVPDLLVGDFDSLGYVPKGKQVIQLPVRKADTDMLYAMRMGLKEGCDRFVLYGALGGRVDHSIANIQCLVWLTTQGARGMMVGDEQTMVVSSGTDTLRFSKESEGIVSIFALEGEARVKISHFDYPYEGILTSTYPMGVSNAFVGEESSVELMSGTVLCVYPTKTASLLAW